MITSIKIIVSHRSNLEFEKEFGMENDQDIEKLFESAIEYIEKERIRSFQEFFRHKKENFGKSYEECVHTEHCCIFHGCKYWNKDCPVTEGTKPQSYPCETCTYCNSDEFNY